MKETTRRSVIGTLAVLTLAHSALLGLEPKPRSHAVPSVTLGVMAEGERVVGAGRFRQFLCLACIGAAIATTAMPLPSLPPSVCLGVCDGAF